MKTRRRKLRRIEKRRHLGQTQDPEFNWVKEVCGKTMEDWRGVAARYMAHVNTGAEKGFSTRLIAIGALLKHYFFKHQFTDPEKFLTLPRNVVLPPLLGPAGEAPFRHTRGGIKLCNCAHDFLLWALENDERLSEEDDGGRMPIPGCRVPFARESQSRLPFPLESVRTPLPYKWILDLRAILAPGENFDDWEWAQGSTGRSQGKKAGDWFEVTSGLIDPSDPDCVWRERQVPVYQDGPNGRPDIVKHKVGGRWVPVTRTICEMWSPVTAVALLMKLELPLRGVQVRMLDSGEADLERVELPSMRGDLFVWRENDRRSVLLSGLQKADRARVGDRQGVFRKTVEALLKKTTTCFFINTNKTADLDQAWANRGYVISWQHASLLRWLIKLRNWQEKYNPIVRPTPWTELEPKHTSFPKSHADLTAASPTCFLFRNAAARGKRNESDIAKPITSGRMDFIWGLLLEELETRLDAAGVRDVQGEKIVLIKARQSALHTTFFPLHSLRVSLLTALAFEGGVTLQTLMQLAGHSRILMAIYYQKMGSVLMGEELEKAGIALAEKADRSLVTWLKQRALDDVAQQIVAADERGLRNAIPDDSADRNPAGWLRVHGGWCLVGGNTSVPEGNRGVGGCYNGGRLVREVKRTPHMSVYEQVRERNCVAGGCRFFVTRPEYMPELKAKLDVLLCQLTDRQSRNKKYESELDALRREKYAAEQDGRPFIRLPELNRAAQLFEKAATELNVTLVEIGNTLRLLDRCMAVFKNESASSTHQLVAQGTITDVRLALESTDSELLQLSGVCHDAEVYPELEGDVGEAVVRRSQILDRVLLREKGQPLLGYLDKDEQLRLGNRIVRELTRTYETTRAGDGMKAVVFTLECGDPLPPDLRETLDDQLAAAGYNLDHTPIAVVLATKKMLIATE